MDINFSLLITETLSTQICKLSEEDQKIIWGQLADLLGTEETAIHPQRDLYEFAKKAFPDLAVRNSFWTIILDS